MIPLRRVLIANRGEIAIRLARAVEEHGACPVAAYAEDEAEALHVLRAQDAVPLPGVGARAYLDIGAVVEAARSSNCDAVHPGYGFLSESADLARACAAAGITFIGPAPEALETFGDKGRARRLAQELGVPIVPGTDAAADLHAVAAFLASLPAGAAMILKAISGGGGRGMRIVRNLADLPDAFAACAREAAAAFGQAGVYAERYFERVRHVEVQIAGDGEAVVALGDRDCSLQRRHQKLIEIAPAPDLAPQLRRDLTAAAVRLGEAVAYRTLGTVEFLLDTDTGDFAFIETNPRLQVEHTVTEEVTGLDLCRLQLDLAEGKSLRALGLTSEVPAQGFALQARVNLETLGADGEVRPSGGRLGVYEPPTGRGVRVDGFGYGGYATSSRYDSLLAKVIVRGRTLNEAVSRADRALGEFRLSGVESNIPLLRALLRRPEVANGSVTTQFIAEHASALAAAVQALSPALLIQTQPPAAEQVFEAAAGTLAIVAPLQASLTRLSVSEGDLVSPGQQIAILEAMKMEHVVTAPGGGRIVRVVAMVGDVLAADQPIVLVSPEEVEGAAFSERTEVDLDHIRPDLAEILERVRATTDAARPHAVEQRRNTRQRTARENIADLFDPGSFIEYGALAVAAQRERHSPETLRRISPADGIITGVGAVNGALFPPDRAACIGMAYDFTVFAGTQGAVSHRKTDRMLQVAHDRRLPIIWYVEGGGGRPGDVEGSGTDTFSSYARLSGEVPKIAIASRYCFAGNAAVAGMSEVLIATRAVNIGMAGPAMIEGGGMGRVKPSEIGPLAEQTANGVIDVVAEDEAHATLLAKQALGYFQGRAPAWSAKDQRGLRHAIPENRLRTYDPRPLIETLADEGSFLEIRRDFGRTMIAGLARVEGRPIGLIANDNRHLGGAIDCDGADKAARFMQLCDCFDIPLLSLVDTPGFMVGPDSERAAAVRKSSRLFIAGAKLGVPLFTVVLRKFYGLGGIGMTGGAIDDPTFVVAWPTGEFGSMGLEGAVRLGFRKELDAEASPVARKALYDSLVQRMYDRGKAVEVGAHLGVDAVIDPAETRRWLAAGLASCSRRSDRGSRRWVDAW
jgi:acetyl/propionyl-CoA carboxylase alpha subunit/acetyl-CoA carboxylase carboxyltransferase component